MKYKLLCLDIDETLITDGSYKMTPVLYDALQLASEKVYISFITARSLNPFKQFLETSGIENKYHVVENGAKIINPKGEIVKDLHIPHAQVQKIIDVTANFYLEVGILSDNHWRDNIAKVDTDFAVTGLSLTFKDIQSADKSEEIIDKLDEKFAVYHGMHWTDNPGWRAILIFHKDATKGNGMEYIQKKLNISKKETIAIGDGMTDLSMFDRAGLKVAMENGEVELRSRADCVCQSVQKDGVAKALSKYII